MTFRKFLAAAVLLSQAGLVLPAWGATLNFFQPDDPAGRIGYLIVNNIGTATADLTLSARDDTGTAAPGGAVTMTLNAGQSRYLTSHDLEAGKTSIMKGAFGNGTGFWHIDITSTGTVTAQNFLYATDGTLTELSNPMTAESDGSYLVKFFTEPTNSIYVALLRLRNLTDTSGTVAITAKNSSGVALPGTSTVTLPPYKAVELTSTDLLTGNTALGVTGGLGHGDGYWVMTLTPSVSISASALAQVGSGQISDIGRSITVSPTATTGGCISANFLTLKADSHNSAYPAPSLSVTCSTSQATIVSNGIPNFEFVQTTPSRLQAVSATYHIPLTPTVSSNPATIPLAGPAGVTVGGLPIFGPTESKADGYKDPVKDQLLDYCAGHTAQRGDYHHHFRPDCLFSSIQKAGLVVGYAFDGYPILAPYECTDTSCKTIYKVKSSYQYIGGSTAAWDSNQYVAGKGNLDKCNGMTRPDGTYAYYATDEFPYFMGCYHGVVDSTNIVPQQ